MGVDVEFQAVIPKILSQEEVKELYEEMEDRFNLQHYVDEIIIVPQEDLKYWEDFTLPDGSTLLDFKSTCRLYGMYYERGELLPWIIFAEYIEWKYQGAWVSYTGDCNWLIYPWTKEDREVLKLHYFEHCNKPYTNKDYRDKLYYSDKPKGGLDE